MQLSVCMGGSHLYGNADTITSRHSGIHRLSHQHSTNLIFIPCVNLLFRFSILTPPAYTSQPPASDIAIACLSSIQPSYASSSSSSTSFSPCFTPPPPSPPFLFSILAALAHTSQPPATDTAITFLASIHLSSSSFSTSSSPCFSSSS